jgi:hypothetical protein
VREREREKERGRDRKREGRGTCAPNMGMGGSDVPYTWRLISWERVS